jgi:hypothetical protein
MRPIVKLRRTQISAGVTLLCRPGAFYFMHRVLRAMDEGFNTTYEFVDVELEGLEDGVDQLLNLHPLPYSEHLDL